MFGLTAPVFVDADGDGVFTSARGYAQRLVDTHAAVSDLFAALAGYDDVVSSHAAELLEATGVTLDSDAVQCGARAAAPKYAPGITAYVSREVTGRCRDAGPGPGTG